MTSCTSGWSVVWTGITAMGRRLTRPEGRVRGIVAELVVLEQVPDHVHPEAVHPPLQPEAHDLVHRRPHCRVAPVEVGLRDQECVVVVLAGARVQLPSATPERGAPVVGRPPIRRRVAPDVPVAPRALAGGAALLEPRMPVGGVIRHQVEQDLQLVRMGGGQECVELPGACRRWDRSRCSRRRRSRNRPSARERSARFQTASIPRSHRYGSRRGSPAGRQCRPHCRPGTSAGRSGT